MIVVVCVCVCVCACVYSCQLPSCFRHVRRTLGTSQAGGSGSSGSSGVVGVVTAHSPLIVYYTLEFFKSICTTPREVTVVVYPGCVRVLCLCVRGTG